MLVAGALLAAAMAPAGGQDPERCWRREVQGTSAVMVYLGDRACVDLQAPRELRRLWIDAFEGSRFLQDARTVADIPPGGYSVWFNLDEEAKVPDGFKRRDDGTVYKVRLIGRLAKDMKRRPLEGYGHFGMSQGLVVVDRLIEVEELARR